MLVEFQFAETPPDWPSLGRDRSREDLRLNQLTGESIHKSLSMGTHIRSNRFGSLRTEPII